MAVTTTHRWISSGTNEFLEIRINGSRDGHALPEKIVTVSASKIAEGLDLAALFAKEKAAGEQRLTTLIAARAALEDL